MATPLTQSIFSPLGYFKWSFYHRNNPSSVSCIASSVEEARELLLLYLVQIEDLIGEKKYVAEQLAALYNKSDKSVSIFPEIQRLNESLRQKLPPIEDNTGCYCTRVIDYSREMQVTYYKDETFKDMTLGDLILTIDPTIKQVPLVTFSSCLDG